MNIAMFTNTYLPHVGGVAKSVHMVTQDLRETGNQVLVVAPEFPESDALEESEDEVLRVPAIQNFNGSDFSVRIAMPFLIDGAMDDFMPDIIHSHHPYLLGDAALRAARRRGLPLVFTHHTRYEEYSHYVAKDASRMKNFARNLSTEYANLCTHVVAPSRSIADLIKTRGVVTPITEIPTGVDREFFAGENGRGFRKEHHLPEAAFVIGHLGRLAPEKNLEYLAQAVSEAMTTLPDTRFLVVGAGPSEADIFRVFHEKGLDRRLVMAGKQTGDDLREAYHAMDLFVFASKSETQGMVLTEAMAAGLPVIALDAPGAREVVLDGRNGRLLQSEADPGVFAEAIRELVEDPETALSYRTVALETADGFDRRKCARKLLDLYEGLLSAPGSHAAPESETPAVWDDLMKALRAEWELIREKARALSKTHDES